MNLSVLSYNLVLVNVKQIFQITFLQLLLLKGTSHRIILSIKKSKPWKCICSLFQPALSLTLSWYHSLLHIMKIVDKCLCDVFFTKVFIFIAILQNTCLHWNSIITIPGNKLMQNKEWIRKTWTQFSRKTINFI